MRKKIKDIVIENTIIVTLTLIIYNIIKLVTVIDGNSILGEFIFLVCVILNITIYGIIKNILVNKKSK